MRKILILVLLAAGALLLPGKVAAQGNLQFNAVKYIQMSVTQSGTTVFTETSQVVTVPANKVWKIEMIATTATNNGSANSSSGSNSGMVILDDRILYNSNSTNQPAVPFWLPAGTYTLSFLSNTLSNGHNAYSTVSVLEFNVVP